MYECQLIRSIARGWFIQSAKFGLSVSLEGFELPDDVETLPEMVRQAALRAVLSDPAAVDVEFAPEMYDYSFARDLSLRAEQWNALLSGVIEFLRPVADQEERIASLSVKMSRVIEVLDVWEDATFMVNRCVLEEYIEAIKTGKVNVPPNIMNFMASISNGMDDALSKEFSTTPIWHTVCQEELDNKRDSMAIEAAERFFKNPRHIRNVAGAERYVIIKVVGEEQPKFTYDYCDDCGVEVPISNEYTPQKCPTCGRTILPCCYCSDLLNLKDAHYCDECPFEKN